MSEPGQLQPPIASTSCRHAESYTRMDTPGMPVQQSSADFGGPMSSDAVLQRPHDSTFDYRIDQTMPSHETQAFVDDPSTQQPLMDLLGELNVGTDDPFAFVTGSWEEVGF
jgi:hypothetical protein